MCWGGGGTAEREIGAARKKEGRSKSEVDTTSTKGGKRRGKKEGEVEDKGKEEQQPGRDRFQGEGGSRVSAGRGRGMGNGAAKWAFKRTKRHKNPQSSTLILKQIIVPSLLTLESSQHSPSPRPFVPRKPFVSLPLKYP